MGLLRRPIAIVGLACRFPGAPDPTALWHLLREGRDTVSELPAERWRVAEVYDPDASRPGTISTRFGSFLPSVDGVDWRALRISPREARFMDPQHRLLLELAWEALEDAGMPFERVAGARAGVYIGIKWNDYAKLQALRPAGIDSFTVNGSDLALAANRISYQFDFIGPSMAFDVGCASSLVAVHLACQGLLHGETELAIAGGVNLMLALDSFIAASKAGLLSPDGRCKMFDASANGYVRSEGGGAVVLKPLDRALADGDRVWGVIRGSAAMHNGRTEWIMASSPASQQRLMREALDGSGVDPAEVGYVELHGTGTRKGDPIEARAVGAAYGGAARRTPLRVGSIKTNLGHAEAAAGIAGLAKVLVALDAGELPRNLHFHTPNPEIPLAELGIEVVTEHTPWPAPRIAAVNSLSFGGGNAHVVVEAAPPVASREAAPARPTLIVLSSRSEAGLRAQAARLQPVLASGAHALRDIAYTAAVRRTHHAHRAVIGGTTVEELARRLGALAAGDDADGVTRGEVGAARQPVLVFSGQGTTWLGMGRALLASEPVFRDALYACDAAIAPYLNVSFVEELARGEGAWRLDRTNLAQPAIFAIQVAYAALWRAWGVTPAAIVGHSIGELAAAHVAGVLSLDDAARIACVRGRLMHAAAGQGRMVQVQASADALAPRLANLIEIAAYNAPHETVLSGDRAAIEALAAALTAEGIGARVLGVDYAFHSYQLDGAATALVAQIGEVASAAPAIPLYSTRTGQRAGADDFTAAYWGRQLREPVRFAQAIEQLIADGHDTFLEVGPAAVLGPAMLAVMQARGVAGAVVASARRGRDDRAVVLGAAAALHVRGVGLAFDAMLDAGRVVSLPGYAWQRERLWFDASPVATPQASTALAIDPRTHPLIDRHVALAEPRGAHVWDATLDPRTQPWLVEHVIDGAAILPASAYVELAASAMRDVVGARGVRLSALALERALVVRGAVAVQIAMSPADGAWTFEIFAREVDVDAGTDAAWTRHASGRIELDRDAAEPMLAIDAVRAALPDALDQAACYAAMGAIGFAFGASFRGIAAAWRRDGEVLARIEVPPAIAPGGYHWHPAVLDACMHAMPLAAPGRGATGRGCMPISIGDIRVLAGGGAPAWTRVRFDAIDASAPTTRADIEIFDAAGRALLTARGLVLRWLDGRGHDAWCYRMAYRPAPIATTSLDRTIPWLVIGDRGGIGEATARLLRARGAEVSVASSPAAIPTGRRHIVYAAALDARGLDGATSGAIADELDAALAGVLAVAQQLARDPGAQAKLWLVTRGGRGMELASDVAVSPVQAALWGLGRTIAQEQPALWGGLIDLDPAASTDELAPQLVDALTAPIADDVVIRGGARHVPRLVRARVAQGAAQIRDDGAYLVTGAFGGLGQLVARWLVERGARTIVLVGRAALPARDAWDALEAGSPAARQAEQVRALEALGATVHVATVDVAVRAQLASWRAAYRAAGGPPIRGVVHCAGRVAFESIAQISPASRHDVIDGKALGAAWLHAELADEPLEMFALFSSAASVLDSPMFGHYAAGNAFLDAFAHARAARGLPAVSINWGAWSEVGMVTRGDGRGPAAGHGVELIEPAVGLALLDQILATSAPQIAVLAIDWPVWRAAHRAAASAPLLAELMPAEVVATPVASAPAADAPPDVEELTALVRREIARALYLESPDEVEADRPIRELGFDSLMATELSALLGKRLGVALAATVAFDHPTPRALAEHLIARLAAAAPVPVAPVAPVVEFVAAPVEDARLVKLSRGQERLYVLDRLAPGTAQYVEYFALRIAGALDEARLSRALAALVQRHEVLRTVFVEIAALAEPRALVAPDGAIALDVADLREAPDALLASARDVLGRPFDLARGPLTRALLARLADEQYALWFAQHHIVTDAISIGVLVDELAQLYAGDVLAPAVRFSDVARVERASASAPAYVDGLAWWRTQLADVPRLALPYARAAIDATPEVGAAITLAIPRALVDAARTFARREGRTLFELALAAWACTLQRYTGQHDFAIGTMMARDRGDAPVLGFFVNTVALRCDLSGQPAFAAVAARLSEAVREAVRHRDIDFGDVVHALRGAGGDARPLIQTTLNLVPAFPAPRGAGWAWADGDWAPAPRPAKFELALELVEHPDDPVAGLRGKLEFATPRFAPDTAQRMARHFEAVLAEGIASSTSIDALAPLARDARRQLLVDWNATEAAYPEACLHALFAAQAARTPDAIAVRSDAGDASFAAIDARANQLAHHLVALGAGRDTRVAVCMPRSIDTVVALLGVLKADAAYVPVDPGLPRERIAFMLEDAHPIAVIGAAGLPIAPGVAHVCMARDAAAVAAQPTTPVISNATPDDVAYAIYTSGSTGRPKAVLGTHRGAVNFLAWLWRAVPFAADEVCAQKTSLSFVDAFVEIFAPLLQGVPLVVIPDRVEADPEALIARLAAARVTRLVLVPSLLAAMLELGDAVRARLGALRTWLLSGEALPDALCARLAAQQPDAVIINTYGSSEVAANVTWARWTPGEPMSIGRPLSNARVYVLDAHRQPLPIDVAGELYVGGAGVARGYLGQPALTDERFVVDPFSDSVGARLYRTGDRACWRADGTLDYLGRLDHQVKIRGHRVELGEVEAALAADPCVRAAAAVVREDAPGDRRLVAYVVPSAPMLDLPSALREVLRTTLPEPMVPSAFVVLDALPLTASGKLDRKALVARAAPQIEAPVQVRVAPEGELARAVAAVWRDVLGRAEVDARQSFFDQGGSSLLLVRVHQRLRNDLALDVTVAELFGYPTIEALTQRFGGGAKPVASAVPARSTAAKRRGNGTSAPSAMSVDELERLIDDKYQERTRG